VRAEQHGGTLGNRTCGPGRLGGPRGSGRAHDAIVREGREGGKGLAGERREDGEWRRRGKPRDAVSERVEPRVGQPAWTEPAADVSRTPARLK
jgi:hypothetical protein